jgi:neutral ceramidase
MKTHCLIVLLLAAILGMHPSPSADAAELRAGVAKVEITPPVPYRMSGYFSERLSTGTHDPLYAKALVFKQGETEAALVFCDLIGVSLDVSRKARRLASDATGIPIANILISATHSHTGPLYAGALRNQFHEQAVAKSGNDPYETVDYPAQLAAAIARSIEEAQAKARPVQLAAGVAEQKGLSFNRRFHMRDGTVRFNPGKLNPDIVRVAGPIDPDVGMLSLVPADKTEPLAMLTVFAMHLDTVGGTEYSADYPGHLEKSLQEKYGGGFISLFGAGTCGDINHIDVTTKEQTKGQPEAERLGTTLAKTVLAATAELKPVGKTALAVRSSVVSAPLQKYPPEQVARAKENMFKIGGKELSFLEQVEAYKITSLQLLGDTLPAEVQVFRLSDDVALVGLPGEVFVELGLAIKQASPFKTTLVVELCNDAPGYVPTKKAFAEGSYETVNSRVQSGGGELLVETAVKLLKELKP